MSAATDGEILALRSSFRDEALLTRGNALGDGEALIAAIQDQPAAAASEALRQEIANIRGEPLTDPRQSVMLAISWLGTAACNSVS
jgi:hypothetical protein